MTEKISAGDIRDAISLALRIIPGVPIFAQELIAAIAGETAHYLHLRQQGSTIAEIEIAARVRVRASDWRDLHSKLMEEASRGVPRPDEGA